MSAIEGAETVEDVQTALRTAVYGMKAVKSDAVLLAEAKAAATKAVQEAFDGYKAQDYNADNWESLENFKEDGIKAIANASRISDVEKFRDEAIANMATVKTNAQILDEAKTLAKTELKQPRWQRWMRQKPNILRPTTQPIGAFLKRLTTTALPRLTKPSCRAK